MAAPKAPLLDGTGKKSKDVTLTAEVFGVDVKPHLIHEAVRAEGAAARAGTQAAKSRGLVSGGSRQAVAAEGHRRARAGTTRAPQWTGGGVAFAPQPRSYSLKVNRKARKSALRGALSYHAGQSAFGSSTRRRSPSRPPAAHRDARRHVGQGAPARRHRAAGGGERREVLPNLDRVSSRAVRARGRRARLGNSVLATEAPRKGQGAGLMSLDPREILIAPVVSEKSYSLIEDNKYSFRVHRRRTRRRSARPSRSSSTSRSKA
jgi:hypothetical protein